MKRISKYLNVFLLITTLVIPGFVFAQQRAQTPNSPTLSAVVWELSVPHPARGAWPRPNDAVDETEPTRNRYDRCPKTRLSARPCEALPGRPTGC